MANAVSVDDRKRAGGHDHLERALLNMFDRQPQSVSNSRVALSGGENHLVRNHRHVPTTWTAEMDFTDMTTGRCLELDALRAFDLEDPLEMIVSKDLKEAARFDDLLAKSENRTIPIAECRGS